MIGLPLLPRAAGAALLCAVSLSACATIVGGRPVAGDRPPPPAELTSAAVFDDLTTVDPCSLVDLDAFTEFGEAELGAPESLDYCAVVVSGDDSEVSLSIGELAELDGEPTDDDERVREFDGGLWVWEVDGDPAYCTHQLVFPDDVTLEAAAFADDGEEDTCPMVEAAIEAVVGVLVDDAVEHRDVEEHSLVGIDPCDLIDDDQVAAIPGFAGAQQGYESPARHTCYWDVPSNENLTVQLLFGAGAPPDAYEPGANTNPVAGRPTATNPYPDIGDSAYCMTETGHIPFREIEGHENVVEIASVIVGAPKGQVDLACQAAVALATVAWPELPAP